MRMRCSLGLIALALVAGCGDDGVTDPNSCQPDGFADGELAGTLGPFARAALVTLPASALGTTHALVFDESAGTCGEVTATGAHLSLLFCAEPEERDYILVGQSQFHCPGDNVLGLVEKDGGVDVTFAASGTIAISSRSPGCLRGVYSADLAGALIEGAFDAVVCAP